LTDVLEMLTAYVFRAMVEAVSTSETSVYFYEKHCTISLKAVIFSFFQPFRIHYSLFYNYIHYNKNALNERERRKAYLQIAMLCCQPMFSARLILPLVKMLACSRCIYIPLAYSHLTVCSAEGP
jgi:hypothetical protein